MKIPDSFENVNVLVVGDVMLDRYWWGEVTRISPEAPVPIVHLRSESLRLGGAANVAANIAGLGGKPILFGCVGDDREADELKQLLKSSGIDPNHLFTVPDRRTTVKTRVIAHSQQVTRIDHESAGEVSPETRAAMIERCLDAIPQVNAVAMSDYAKGVLHDDVLSAVISTAVKENIPVIVDPKGRDFSKYENATLVTPNRREAAIACNIDDGDRSTAMNAGQRLISELGLNAVLVTEGEDGMTLFESGSDPVHFSAMAREVYDVTGAGDTVLAALSVSVGSGRSFLESAKLANVAAGLIVERVGTSVITIDAIRSAGPEYFSKAGE